MKTAFLILGAQRSGTSVTSHMLSMFGVNFGNEENFLQDPHNPISFELNWVNEYNNKIINALGYEYTDYFLPLEKNFEKADTAKIEKELQALIRNEWQNAPVIGIKDPRFALTFPVWEKILLANNYKLKIILAFRNPSSFLKSNKKVLPSWIQWEDNQQLDFWYQLNLSAVYFTRNYPVHYISYDSMMSDRLAEANKLASVFNLDPNLAIPASQVVKRSHYHHRDLAKTNHHFVDNCYNFLCSQAISIADYLHLHKLVLTQ